MKIGARNCSILTRCGSYFHDLQKGRFIFYLFFLKKEAEANARQCNSRGRGALGVAGGGAGGERREAGGAHRARLTAGAAAVVESVVWARLEVRLVFASLIIEAAVRRDLMSCNDKKERSAPCSGAPGQRGSGEPSWVQTPAWLEVAGNTFGHAFVPARSRIGTVLRVSDALHPRRTAPN